MQSVTVENDTSCQNKILTTHRVITKLNENGGTYVINALLCTMSRITQITDLLQFVFL